MYLCLVKISYWTFLPVTPQLLQQLQVPRLMVSIQLHIGLSVYTLNLTK